MRENSWGERAAAGLRFFAMRVMLLELGEFVAFSTEEFFMPDFASSLPDHAPNKPFERLCWIMDELLSESGCPWDREQNHETLKQYLIEEAYEVHEAIEMGDHEHLQEELGDVALQVVFHAAIAKKNDQFNIDDVLMGICDKLVRRHPHVFGETEAKDSGKVLENWEQIKQKEKKNQPDKSLVGGVPKSLPALQKAHRMQEKVRRVGFDWANAFGALEKAREEFEELAAELDSTGPGKKQRVEHELGDLFFALTNVARWMDVQPEEALQAACGRFATRFRHIESRAKEENRNLQDMSLEEMDAYWKEAKEIENETV